MDPKAGPRGRDKLLANGDEAVAGLEDGATVLVGGFGVIQGWPSTLIGAVQRSGRRDLTIVCNSPGVGPTSLQVLAQSRQIRKLVASFAAYPTRPTPIEAGIRSGAIELELVPQGTLIERVRAGGSGLAAFYTPTSVGTPIGEGKELRRFGDRDFVLETAIRGDFGLVRAARADRAGNAVYRGSSRNLNATFTTAARTSVIEVDEVVETGGLDPEAIHTPGVFVDRVVRNERPLDAQALRALSRRHGKQWDLEARERSVGPRGLPPDLMALRAARLLAPGEYVNLGLGLPTLLSNHVGPESGIMLHSENGMLGYGPLAEGDDVDIDLYNASGQLVTLLPGGSFFGSDEAFAMARSGRVSTVVLGGFQVSQAGDLANWNVPATGVGGIGGAMDLAAGAARIVVVMFHLTRAGEPKLLERCTYPLTAVGCVRTVLTDLALIDVDASGFVLRELAPGVSADEVRAVTAAPLRLASDLREMDF
ncbi:MAG TPA: 3-oxoacid CoA-transferase subunit B [Candidatus Binatia bacterium]|nr:3-oxoacid CoA-transferase subunit B [Candidatus Binatia bacterium]